MKSCQKQTQVNFKSKKFKNLSQQFTEVVCRYTFMSKKVKQTVNYVQKLDKQVFSQQVVNKFACECGKEYLNFPALYLHFQRSHKIKISTKLKQQLCSVSKQGQTRIFFYYFSKLKTQNEEQKKQDSLTSKVLKQFVDSISNEWDKYPALYMCSNLHKFLQEQDSWKNNMFQIAKVASIPSYFNDFVEYSKLMMKTEQAYSYYCKILIQLCKWMNFKGYSYIKLQYSPTENQQDNLLKVQQTQ